MKSPKIVTLMRSDKTTINHEYRWFIVPIDDHMPIFSPHQSGDKGLKECLTWLKSRGYVDTDGMGEFYTLAD